MGLSSNILWHQTDFYTLKKILKDKEFFCSYSLEDTSFLLGAKTAFAMVSMCDLPFSELSTYLGKYGGYCLGFSRSWGINQKFNPVWYCDPNSMAADAKKSSLKNFRSKSDSGSEVILLTNVLSFVKMVEGELPKRNYKRYRFYDEREVRYVPSFLSMLNHKEAPMMDEKSYNEYKKAHNNSSTLDYGVKFEWTDLKYIIVKEEHQILAIRNHLTSLGCPTDSVQIFFSKQVEEDFIGENHNEIVEPVTIEDDNDNNLLDNILKIVNGDEKKD